MSAATINDIHAENGYRKREELKSHYRSKTLEANKSVNDSSMSVLGAAFTLAVNWRNPMQALFGFLKGSFSHLMTMAKADGIQSEAKVFKEKYPELYKEEDEDAAAAKIKQAEAWAAFNARIKPGWMP